MGDLTQPIFSFLRNSCYITIILNADSNDTPGGICERRYLVCNLIILNLRTLTLKVLILYRKPQFLTC